jgi:hypothetical protein
MYKYQIIKKETDEVVFNNRISSETQQLAQQAGEAKRIELSLSSVNYDVVISPVSMTNLTIKRGEEVLENHDTVNDDEIDAIFSKYNDQFIRYVMLLPKEGAVLADFDNDQITGSMVVELI